MKKIFVISIIISLILFTAIIKNSTKRIDDEIFAINDNLRVLKKNFENIKLENEYLSSTEKLIELQNLYFEDELVKNDINKIRIISKQPNKLEIKELKFINEK